MRQCSSLTLLILTSTLLAACNSGTPLPVAHSTNPPAASPTATAILAATPIPTLTPKPTLTSTPLPPSATPTLTATSTPRPTASPQHFQVFDEIWQVIRDEYLYPDFNGLDWNAIHDEYQQRIAAGMTGEEFYQAMSELVSRLGDEHSSFFSPEEAKEEDEEFAGKYDYAGIGVLSISVPERQRVTIISVFPGSPAEQAGLQIRDSILAADDVPILDENGIRRDILRGPQGTSIILTVQTPGQEPRQVPIVRQRITGEIPVPYTTLTTPNGKRIGFIFLVTFNDSTVGDQVREALRAMSAEGALDGIIIDNRQNGGGSSDVLKQVLSYFSHGTVGHFINRQNEEPLRLIGENIGGSQDLPLVVLVGRDSVSFGEIFPGILHDIGRAYLIGETTNGNVEILYIYNFSDGSRAWLAHDTFRPLNHPDENWEETGIIPDLFVISNWDDVTLETDPVIQAALEHFDQSKGLR